MSQDGHRPGRVIRLAFKIGTVAGAAAALIAENATSGEAGEASPRSPARIGSSPAIARKAEPPVPGSPPPLVLKPSRLGARLILAGHRSHSSHSSHSSHVSGASYRSHSSHTSHFSSTIGSGSSRPSSGSSLRSAGSNYILPSIPAPADVSNGIPESTTDRPAPKSAATTTRVPTKPAPKAEPAVDLRDPANRYKLMSVNNFNGTVKAFIKDLLVGQPKLIKVGEEIGDSKLVDIARDWKSVRLKPPAGPEVNLKLNAPAK